MNYAYALTYPPSSDSEISHREQVLHVVLVRHECKGAGHSVPNGKVVLSRYTGFGVSIATSTDTHFSVA